MSQNYVSSDQVPVPPSDAKVYHTACDYCIVGCGYRVFVWPVGQEGGQRAADNALRVDFPTEGFPSLDDRPARFDGWVTPNQHNITLVGGEPHHVVVQPDPQADVVNRRGNHSIRGGTLAQKLFNPDGPTKDRLQHPLLRVNGELSPVSWDAAFEIMARVSQHVLQKYGAPAWGMKTYSYQYFENTFAISKLAFRAIKTPAYAPHDKPGPGNDTAGLDDSGIIPFSASYEDWSLADVIFFSGVDPYETKTVLFTEWIMGGKSKKLIFTNPRKSTGIAWGEKNGGLFLQVIPGTDTVLHMALSRIILERGWEDQEFIERWIASSWEIGSGMGRGTRNTPWQWRTTWGKIGTDFEGYRTWLFDQPESDLTHAADITGVPAEKIVETAEALARPINGRRPKTSFAFEKGNYWSNNFLNTASFSALALLCGSGNRPGQMVSRLGGHQRGWIGAASYPLSKSPNKLPGRRRQEIDLDRWVEAGHLRFAWVIGTTWLQAMAASQELYKAMYSQTRGSAEQVTSADTDSVVDTLLRRVDSGGMVLIDQDIYLRKPIGAELADLVLPAATWGEEDFSRCNGERRLRLYPKFCDPPGEAKPDWWIISSFAKKMGFEGFNWIDSTDVFEEAAVHSRGGMLDYYPLAYLAKRRGRRAHDLLRDLGTTGIQTPLRLVDGELVGTKRLHDSELVLEPPRGPTIHQKWLTQFKTQSGKAILLKSPWDLFSDFYERITPRGDEFWVVGGRINEVWQSGFDDSRKPYISQRWPDNFVEIHPDDASSRGIESGDSVVIESDDILIQTGGFTLVEGDAYSFTNLQKNGFIRRGTGSCAGVAIVTAAVRPGVLFTNALWAEGWPNTSSNSLVHRVPDPITNRYRFKLGKGKLRRTGESPYKREFQAMSFKSRLIL